MSATDDELMVFADEPERLPVVASTDVVPWLILNVDDDPDVHVATELALKHLEILGRPLAFVRAYSAAEALSRLQSHPGIAVILLDVVMEDDHAGLHLVRRIRQELALLDVRIILRTGQPGYAPEVEAIRDYDINDYKNKTELTQTKLYTALTAAVRSFAQIQALEASRRGLELIVQASAELLEMNDHRAFARNILLKLTQLLHLSGNGVVCTRNSSAGELDIMAATGRFHSERCVQDVPVRERIERCYSRQAHLFEDDATVLYFKGDGERNLVVFLEQMHRLDDTESRLLDVFCANIAVCLNNLNAMSKLHQYAYFDAMLDIPNRFSFVRQLDEQMARMAGQAQVVLADIDQFSAINDTIGTTQGDHLLKKVAERLVERLPDAFVARISGDTFGILHDRVVTAPNQVRSLFYDPFLLDGQEQLLSATLGLYELDHPHESGLEALKKANIALKRAKELLRGSHCYFTRDMELETENRVTLLQNLRRAFERDRLFLAYQPQVRLYDGKPVGVEALLRWRADDGSMIPPNDFIPLAESSGMIIHLGEWVMKTAMLAQIRLSEAYGETLRMGINVSMAQFRHPQFLPMLDQAVVETGVHPEDIELEITESVAMLDRKSVDEVLRALNQRGFRIAIDDFGTGFSSLSYLEKLTVHRLKIDKSFIDKIEGEQPDSRLPDMIVKLAKDLNLSVIAEGVEREEQARWLRKIDCEEAQGFLYARPLEESWLREWLREQAESTAPATEEKE